MKINIFWFRRDLRLEDNTALQDALQAGLPVLPVFIFDSEILDDLPADDPRTGFIFDSLEKINNELVKYGSSIYILRDNPESAWNKLIVSFDIKEVYINKDYEPYAINRDKQIETLINQHNIILKKYKDQVIFEEDEIVKSDGNPYTVFTPYKKQWLLKFQNVSPGKGVKITTNPENFYQFKSIFPSLKKIGLRKSNIKVRDYDLSVIREYHLTRDLPAEDRTSYLSPHLRFGTVSIRKIVSMSMERNQVFLSELVWREFFMQILYHFPNVVTESFKSKYDNIKWRNNEKEFEKWCKGETGYPIVDAGLRQLNETGYMHNRVRMVAAGFLCKHLLIDWRWGEAYFASRLLDYELSSNNGNWQWAAGTGCDAAPYFRVFNPQTQQGKFDPRNEYSLKWIPELGNKKYPKPVIEHKIARERAISAYRDGLKF